MISGFFYIYTKKKFNKVKFQNKLKIIKLL